MSKLSIECYNIDSGYYGIKVLWNINLKVRDSEIVSILGPNGAGKTTLMKTLAGVLKPMNGRIMYYGEDITRLPAHLRVRRGLVLIPENRGNLFPDMSVRENLLMGAYLLKHDEDIRDRMEVVFNIFPVLKERLNQKARTLSGGEQQMLSIGIGLMSKPRVLLLDEPTMGLSPKFSSIVIDSIKQLRDQLKTTIVLVEEKISYALKISDRIYIISQGRIEHELSASEAKTREDFLSKYLGI
ncbi:ABC transporter ATP-binding protein [Thermogladius sp. 4427co]|uniref:ABC transporter ATP-binding protein n=1 Tax=Thermogladius sp. 4427co TaxID=3450718 RepID=UPI003F7A8486